MRACPGKVLSMTLPEEILFKNRLDILELWLDEWPEELGEEMTGRMGYICSRWRRLIDRELVRVA